jgi:hypothetical protein
MFPVMIRSRVFGSTDSVPCDGTRYGVFGSSGRKSPPMPLNASFVNIPVWQGLDGMSPKNWPGLWTIRSARLATLAQDGYSDCLRLASARLDAATLALADFSRVRSPGDLVDVQRRLAQTAATCATAEFKAIVGLGTAVAMALWEAGLRPDAAIGAAAPDVGPSLVAAAADRTVPEPMVAETTAGASTPDAVAPADEGAAVETLSMAPSMGAPSMEAPLPEEPVLTAAEPEAPPPETPLPLTAATRGRARPARMAARAPRSSRAGKSREPGVTP